MSMDKKNIRIEHPLATRSANIAWSMIGTVAGLQKWMADEIAEEDCTLVFKWGEEWSGQDVRKARVVERNKPNYVRMQWEEDEGKDCFLELFIEQSDLTGQLHLTIVDCCDPEDEDSLMSYWDDCRKRLHQVSGM